MISLVKLSWKNILRYRTRSFLTIFGVACSVGVLFSILSFHIGFERNLAKEIEKTGIDFMIVAKGCSYEVASLVLYGAVLPKFLEEGVLDKVREVEHVEFTTPILVGQLPNLKKSRLDVIYGMVMSDIPKAKPEWDINGKVPDRGDEVILGYLLAEQYKLHLGDEIAYGSDGIKVHVSGILKRVNSQEDSAVFMPIQTLQEILGKPAAITSIGVKAKHSIMIDSIRDLLSLKVPGIQIVTMGQIRENISNIAASARAFTLTIAIVVALVSIIGVVNSILITIFERRKEIGMMRAMGASRSNIFRWTLCETAILVSLGGCAGILIGILGSGVIENLVRKVTPYVPSGKIIVFEPGLAALIFASSLLVGMVAGIYPAWKSSRVSPIEVINC